ncbi:hypothetical protein B5807_04975 [Epicoccum nigrum]|uniref:IBR domain-containing protein n=1 Tax=Epicoccum nigrum TaxID=105696 RepID=A0A1Y2M2H8_EPING|nr:hypothetical protein B5807_04975 [Epicoccum nigrum]
MLVEDTESHVCEENGDYKQFRGLVRKSYRECPECRSAVELRDACNHITCTCGTQFCYACGKIWPGVHGCPNYGPAIYDDEGFNQDGYHRKTGRNWKGYTREQQELIDRGEYEEASDDEDDEDEDDEDDDDDDDEHEETSEDEDDLSALQYVDPDVRAAFAAMGRDERDIFLIILQISLSEQQNLLFDNSNVLTGDQGTVGGDEFGGDAGSESDPSGSYSNSISSGRSHRGEDPTSLGLGALRIGGGHNIVTTAGEPEDGNHLDIGWARLPGSWPIEEEL